MKTAFDTGLNRTGLATSPIEGPRTVDGAEKGGSSSPGDSSAIGEVRAELAGGAGPIGSVPPPASLKGIVKTAAQALKGEKATVFLDKLGERLAFERTGVRLYEIVLSKLDAYPTWDGGPTRAELLDIQHDELSHMGILADCLQQLGADPTCMTPSADVAANLSKGVPQVLADPRTDLRQCLEGLLVAELTDNACWETLISLARDLGQDAMADRFERCLESEEDHLDHVRNWVRAGILAALHAAMPTEKREEHPPLM